MRIGICLALAALLWAAPGCKKKNAAAVAQDPRRLPIAVTIGDPRSAQQLISGFYDIEGGSWRGTSKRFVIELGTPLGSAGRGASLEFKFTVPAVAIEK